jgi:hypothetical protein
VGAWKTPIIERFSWIPVRDALDIAPPYCSPTVRGIHADFFTYAPEREYDVVLCLQVLEHLNDPASFARKLFSTGRNVVISVPFLWPEGACQYHCQDPVDHDKVRSWTGREPTYSVVINEGPARCSDRLICYYRPDPLTEAERTALAAGISGRPATSIRA